MKKFALILALILLFSAYFLPVFPRWAQTESDSTPVFSLPMNLVLIEDEAFAETAVEVISFPKSLVEIGERAFAGTYALREISIPDSVQYIADRAFEGCHDIIIHSEIDSYAANWAREHNVTLVSTENGSLIIEKRGKLLTWEFLIIASFNCVSQEVLLRLHTKRKNADCSMRPQDRPELYPIEYRFP